MAKYKVEFELHVGDYVEFNDFRGYKIEGYVQSVDDFPVVWIETGDPRRGDYKRYEIPVYKITYSNKDYKKCQVEFEDDEPLEEVWSKDHKSKKIVKRYKK